MILHLLKFVWAALEEKLIPNRLRCFAKPQLANKLEKREMLLYSIENIYLKSRSEKKTYTV